MKDTGEKIGLFIALSVLGFAFGALGGMMMVISGRHTEQVIVDHQCAHYDTKTGNFVWNNEVVKP